MHLHDAIAEALGLPADTPDEDLVAEVDRIAKRIRRADRSSAKWKEQNPERARELNRIACRKSAEKRRARKAAERGEG